VAEIEHHIDECLHLIRSAYGWMSEADILWRDWHWVNDTIESILRDKREARRWDLMARLASASAGSGSEPAFEWWQTLVDSTLTAAERIARVEAEEAEAERKLAEERKERVAALMAQLQAQGLDGSSRVQSK
jgi:hypothetical protein